MCLRRAGNISHALEKSDCATGDLNLALRVVQTRECKPDSSRNVRLVIVVNARKNRL
jgi:hypothetical protein